MQKLEERCWFKENLEPSECPFILPNETHLMKDRNKRIRQKCVECGKFYHDIQELSGAEDQIFEIMKIIIDELQARQKVFRRFQQLFSVSASKMHLLHRVLESLHSTLDLKRVAYTIMVSVTAGDGVGFNRGFLLLRSRDGTKLVGYFGVGPKDENDAFELWNRIKHLSIDELIRSYSPERFEEEHAKFKNLLPKLAIPTDMPILRKLTVSGKALVVKSPTDKHFREIANLLGVQEFAVVPLSIRDEIIGLIIADNFVTDKSIGKDELEFLEIVAYQATLALTRALFYEELQRKVEELDRINRLLREYHEEVTRMERMATAGEVIHNITHDFKNPLTVIGGLARTIIEEIDSSHPFYKRLKAIVEETRKLMDMLDNALKEIRSKYSLERSWWNINMLIRRLAERFQPILERDGIKLELKLDPDMPNVFVDLKQMENCIENLILNAIDAMQDGGTLRISTEFDREQNEVRVVVEDTGHGIKQELLDRIFEPFFTTKESGSGLGLYNCREVVRAHGGKITVESEEGKGTRFVISLVHIHEGEGKVQIRHIHERSD